MSVISFSKTILYNLFHKPYTRMYPSVPRVYPARTRGQIANNIDACIFCGICSKKCPTGAIAVDKAEKSWSISRFSCIQCGACTEACPKKCLTMMQAYTVPGAVKTVDRIVQKPKEEAAEPPKAQPAAAAKE